jgi:hypothetical protein
MRYVTLVMLSLSFAVAVNARADDRADLEGTSIIGSRELPKVTYIVPWKKPLPGDLVGRPVTSLLDEALAPVDREEFRRQVEYHGLIEGRQKGLPPSSGLAHAEP